jgi:hypothetical protein
MTLLQFQFTEQKSWINRNLTGRRTWPVAPRIRIGNRWSDITPGVPIAFMSGWPFGKPRPGILPDRHARMAPYRSGTD